MSVIGKVQIYGLSTLAAGKPLDGYASMPPFVLPINATFQLMLNMCLCYCKNTLILFGRSVSLHLFNFLSCYSSNYMHVY